MWQPRFARAAARNGHLNVLRWLHACGLSSTGVAVEACSAGHWLTLAWAADHETLTEDACVAAAARGRVDMLKWLRSRGCPWSTVTTHAAAASGQIATLHWAVQHGCPLSKACATLLAGFSLSDMAWAMRSGCMVDECAAARAAHKGLVDVLSAVAGVIGSARVRVCASELSSIAAQAGHLHVLRWLDDMGLSLADDLLARAAKGGHLAIMAWALERGLEWMSACARAAEAGHLQALRWAVERGAPLHDAAEAAAIGGHLDCMKLALALGPPAAASALLLGSACALSHGSSMQHCIRTASSWPSLVSSERCRAV
jgi:hypothetical protein